MNRPHTSAVLTSGGGVTSSSLAPLKWRLHTQKHVRMRFMRGPVASIDASMGD